MCIDTPNMERLDAKRDELKRLAIKAVLLAYHKNSEEYLWASSENPWKTISQGMRPLIVHFGTRYDSYHDSCEDHTVIAGYLVYFAFTASEISVNKEYDRMRRLYNKLVAMTSE